MVDPERILANALDDDYTRLCNSDFMLPSLEVSSRDDASLRDDETELLEEEDSFGRAVSEMIDPLDRKDFMNLNDDCKITINTHFTLPHTLCTDSQIRLALSEQDLNCIPPCYTIIETAILCGDDPDNPFDTFASTFRLRCIQETMRDRYECMFSFDELLAMLAHVCACSISSLLPPAEVSCPAERYLSDQLRIPELKPIKNGDLKRISIARVKFLFDLISFWDFMHYGETELMLLLFAFSKIYIDELTDIRLKLSICNAVGNVFNGFSERERRAVFYNFSSIFQYIDDSMEGLHVAMKFMSEAPVLNSCKLVCLRRTLVHLVEKAELDPENSEVTDKEHFAVIVMLFADFLRIFRQSRQKVYSMLGLLSETIDYAVLHAAHSEHVTRLVKILTDLKRTYIKERSSNGAILERAVEAIIRRTEIWRPHERS